MNCEESKILINLFIDNEIDSNSDSDLFLHLAECKECRDFLNTIIRFRKNIKMEECLFPESLDQKILSSLSDKLNFKHNLEIEKKKRSFWNWKFSISVPAFAAIILLLILSGIFLVNYFSKVNEQYQTRQTEVTKTDYVILQKLPPIEIFSDKTVKNKLKKM
jgi:hypothetical protein